MTCGASCRGTRTAERPSGARGAGEIRALTSLRGVAALWVFLFHLDIKRPLLPTLVRTLLATDRGYIAVDLFFVLSGFVLAWTYRQSFEKRRFALAYPDFLLRRVARVMPLNAVIVLVLTAAVWTAPDLAADTFAAAKDPWAVLANLFLVQDWGLYPSIDKPAWSVSVEMAVYLTYPLLLAIAWSRRLWPVVALVGAIGLFWLAVTGQGIVSQGLPIGDFIRGFAGFFFGLLCCRAIQSQWLPGVTRWLDLVVLGLFWAALTFSHDDLPAIFLCPALVLSLAREGGYFACFLNLGPVHYLGKISYSIYLVHYVVLGALGLLPIASDGAYFLAALTLTICISAGTYRFIEQPARRRLASLKKRSHPKEHFRAIGS
jgi:peptidoglycan/LPS O-acetylase OafA/YrhL